MLNAQTQSKIKSPEIFTIWSDEIKGRIDPYFYSQIFINTIELLDNLKMETIKLEKIAEIFSGARPKGGVGNIKDGIPSLGGEHILSSGEIKTEKLKFIPIDFHSSHLDSAIKIDDVLLVKDGATTGKVGIIPKNYPYKNCNINEHVFAIRIRHKNKVVPEYIFSFLFSNFGQSQIKREITGATVTGLTRKSVKNIKIPLPSLSIQSKIVSIMQKAYNEKREKEAKAKKILDSIDDYILEELGIKMSKISNKMFFTVYSDELEGRRIDPKAYLETPKEIIKAVRKSEYKSKKLSDIIAESVAGEWGEDPTFIDHANNYVLVNVLRNTNFDNKSNLNFENVAQRLITKDKFKKVRLRKNDILIEKSGGSPIQPVGRVAIFENNNENYAFSNFLQCFRINKQKCLPYYLFVYLKSVYNLGYMEYVQNQTTGIKNLIMEEYLSIPVLLPPLEIQKKIAEKIELYYFQAQTLQEKAKEVLKKAKKEVEKMILK